MKVGDLVKYKAYPNTHLQHMLGLVEDVELPISVHRPGVYVVWNQARRRGPVNTIMFEFMDELEVVSESR